MCRAHGVEEGDAFHGLCALKASLSEHTGPSWNWSWREVGCKRHTPLYPSFIHRRLLRTLFSWALEAWWWTRATWLKNAWKVCLLEFQLRENREEGRLLLSLWYMGRRVTWASRECLCTIVYQLWRVSFTFWLSMFRRQNINLHRSPLKLHSIGLRKSEAT